jgi:hypothetical protein
MSNAHAGALTAYSGLPGQSLFVKSLANPRTVAVR